MQLHPYQPKFCQNSGYIPLRQLPVSLGLLLNIHLRALIKVFIAKRNYIGPLHEQRVEFMPNSMVSKCCCVLLRLML